MNIDWSLIRAFLAVAETGSLSAAARALGASQPTLGRQIKAAEAQLGAELFHRRARGFVLTDAGADLLGPAREMRDAAQQIALRAAGQQVSLAGTVRITASVVLSSTHMAPIIADIRAAEPEIEIELVASDESRNLLYREADIAVRMYRPTQLDLVTRHIGELGLGIYGADTYLARRGMPTVETLGAHDFVGYDQSPLIIEGMRAAGFPVDRHFFKVRCDDQNAYLSLIRAGCGLGFAQAKLMDSAPGLQKIALGVPLPGLPVWLTAHPTMRQTPRVRRVWDLLAAGLAAVVA